MNLGITSFPRRLCLFLQRRCDGFDKTIQQTDSDRPIDVVPPVFIVGPPRSGSTLLTQLMLRTFDLCYFSNVMAQFPRYAIRIAELFPSFGHDYSMEVVVGDLGYLPSLRGPNECGHIMRCWFGQDDGADHSKNVRGTVASLSSHFDCPILIKNMANTFRLPTIQAVFPEARFVVLRRDPAYCAQSILLARKRLFGSFDQWWSVKPPGTEVAEHRDCFAQVAWQVRACEDEVGRRARERPRAFLEVAYEDVCADPAGALHRLGEDLGLRVREDPAQFRSSIRNGNVQRLPDDEWEKLQRAVDEFFGPGSCSATQV